jgi:FkbH-like protein
MSQSGQWGAHRQDSQRIAAARLDFMTNVGRAPENSLPSKLKSGDISFWDDLRSATDTAQTFPEILALSTLRRRALHQKLGRGPGAPPPSIKIALLGGYTSYPLSELVTHFLMTSRPSADAQLFLGEFDNYAAEIMEPDGELAAFAPDVVVIVPAVARCRYEGSLSDPQDAQRSQAAQAATDLLQLADLAHRKTGAPVVLANFPLAAGRDPGAFRVRSAGSDWSFRKLVNLQMGLDAPAHVTICDFEYLSARRGITESRDDRAWLQSKQFGSADFVVDCAREIAYLAAARLRGPKKVVVLDLDNTLWGGVIGDDGVDGILLGDVDATGQAYKAVQKLMLDFKARGLLLAVASKNDLDKAVEPFKTHPEMVLRLGDIVSFQANWGPKPDSLRTIAHELGLGLDSFVFIDDNPAEIEHVRQMLPEVDCILLDEDPARRLLQIQDSRLFDITSLTAEDAQRSEQYRVAAQRQSLQLETRSYDDYLVSLTMSGEISRFNTVDIPRIAQLIARSNQFNLTTIRRQEAELGTLMADPSQLTFTMRLQDRFGDYGLIAIVIATIRDDELIVDTWLMSCRVLKRQVEEEVFNELLRLARHQRLRRIRGVYLRSAKNGMVRDLYATLGFTCTLDEPERREFELDTATAVPFKTRIAITHRPSSAQVQPKEMTVES